MEALKRRQEAELEKLWRERQRWLSCTKKWRAEAEEHKKHELT